MIRATKTSIARAQGAAHAAPTGGACPKGQGWGRAIVLGFMIVAGPSAAETVEVPSGQKVELQEVLLDSLSGEPWARFRFVAPGISRVDGRISHDVAAIDIEALCADFALPYLRDNNTQVTRIVISMADRELEFGATDPEATQFFDMFRPENGSCIWEDF